MNHSVRSLLPSLLLIGIYFIADEFFGTVTGVWVAFLLGGAEFIYTRIREKVYDKMILLTTLFFCIPGLISIWANGSVLSQLQPAIIETALCLLLGFFAFSHTDFTHTLPAGYRKNIHLSGPQLQSMRKMLRILFILVALHTLLAYTAILFLPEDTAKFEYKWQWAYREKFKEAGITALLGSGFDPGVTGVFSAYALKHEFDEINYIDILDCNGGDHGYAFATNFNPEINLREVSAPGSYWENGHWVEIPAMSIKREYNFDQVGQKDMYLLHHEEIESLAKNIPEAKRIRFFMTFGQSYLDHMRCLEDVGMLSTTPVNFNGQEIVPIQFLKALLPDPASLGPRTKGKTNIGCIFTGKKDGKEKTYYIYNVCDHQECYKEVGSQAISYTTGVPAMCGALMLLTGKWTTKGVHTVEEFDPDPYLDALDKYGLPRSESHAPALVD